MAKIRANIIRKKPLLKGRITAIGKSGRMITGVWFKEKGFTKDRFLSESKGLTVKGLKLAGGKVKYKSKIYLG